VISTTMMALAAATAALVSTETPPSQILAGLPTYRVTLAAPIQAQTAFTCHLKTQQIDPELDAKIRIPILEETRAGSKMRFISPSCGNNAQVTYRSLFTVTIPAPVVRKK